MAETIIKIENLYKEYRLGVISTGTLYRDLQSWWARARGKEDPNSLISQSSVSNKELKQHLLALDDISFDVQKSEILGIIGPNGAGKSTLLKILSKVTTPTKGIIKIKGRIGSLLEVGTGFHPELTGRENIYLNGAILGMRKFEIDKKLDEIINFAEMEKFIDTPVKRYSSGMYVRLAFAVAAYLEPEILIVDEVLAVGDAQFQKKCIGKMSEVSKSEGRAVLFVSHNMGTIKLLCSRVILINKGKLIANSDAGSVVDIYLNDVYKEFESPEKSFIIDDSKDFQLLSMKITDNKGNIKQNFECDETVIINMECDYRNRVPGIYGYLSLLKDGTEILLSDTFDLAESSLLDIGPGNYKIKIEIPPRTIGHGTYNINLYFISHQSDKGQFVDMAEYACSFTLNDTATQRGNSRAGYLSTLLKWEIMPV
ncbi:MAG: ABC transporter ATP-binding protein [Bacteroidetes bacterium]|nr:MAG: ABC transporter ATP-binding protein [Bacteroidota bacterium]